jgi:hypothetical protein
MCTEYKLAIWGFENDKLKVTTPIYLIHRPIEIIKVLGDFIYFMFDQGESCYFFYNEKD